MTAAKDTESVPLWNVAQFGWTCVAEQGFPTSSVSTWIRDDSVLVLVWQGTADITAAVLDGRPLPLDQVPEQITQHADDTETLYDRARQHAEGGRTGTELAALFDAMIRLRVDEKMSAPIGLRNRIRNLALAVLSAPAR
jgi:hypothetical protein